MSRFWADYGVFSCEMKVLRDALVICLWILVRRSFVIRDQESVSRLKLLDLFGVLYDGPEVDL